MLFLIYYTHKHSSMYILTHSQPPNTHEHLSSINIHTPLFTSNYLYLNVINYIMEFH